ncbi:hypothetical protein AMS68_004016 [Peltaster fructicola]|uniref:ABC1 atypical kinase-like domain-containing protein n=1 Tax=Peltaster fructicola TaxID=286661 RepID=A0A6H0XV46_9PEZI|nr:hypothetical protein AMS68_004016 [Peltaster fructicola]
MAGKRILDAAKVLHASRAVASQHLKLRRDQWSLWSETSSLAQAVKSQTDRLTVTLQAARELGKRLDEQGPIWQDDVTKRKDDIASKIQADAAASDNTSKVTGDSTPLVRTSTQNVEETGDGTLSALQRRELQRQAERQIPSVSADTQVAADTGAGSDTFDQRSGHISPELSSLPRKKLPRATSDVQGTDEHVSSKVDQDVYYTRTTADAPDGVNTDVFYSPRVAEVLGQSNKANPYRDRQKLPPKPLPEMVAAADRRKQNASVMEDQTTATTTEATEPADSDMASLAQSIADEPRPEVAPVEEKEYHMRESRVPSSRFGRLWQYGGLATSMAFGAVNESFRRATGGGATGSLMLSEANMSRLVAKLSRMRGAALKLGQMMSFQDSKVLPPAINTVLQRVQDSADYMPASQRNKVLVANLGDNWRDLYSYFEEKPFAAASIGQVHKATLASNGRDVAVKIQYPGVRNSIDSDLNNLSLLLTASRLLPRGLFLEKTIANARLELGWECDYEREAEACTRFRGLIADEPDTFAVPEVYTEACGPDVLTLEFMSGKAVTKIPTLTQDERDWLGTQILRLCLRELMEWRFMQTDPNWTNFLYDRETKRLQLLDFGASREFPDKFVEPYVSLLIAASKKDRDACRDLSIELGYLTGQESPGMLKAHVDSILTLAEPFMSSAPEVYDFKSQTITDRHIDKKRAYRIFYMSAPSIATATLRKMDSRQPLLRRPCKNV